MILRKIRRDLAISWQVFRELRAALDERPLLEPARASPAPPDSAPSSSLSGVRRSRATVHIALQGLILLGAATLALFLARILPENRIGPEERMRYLQDHPEDFDVIAVGSSRIQSGLPVAVFDETLREHGLNLKPTFNMGIADASMHQNFYTIRRLLDSGVRPRYLFVEAAPFTSATKGSRIKRVESWHDLKETIRVLKTTLEERNPRKYGGTRAERIWMHLQYFCKRNLLLGRMLRFDSMIDLEDADPLFVERRGYRPIPYDGQAQNEFFQRFVQDPSLWDERIAELAAGYDGEYPKPVNVEAYEDLIDYVRGKDVKLVFVGTPFSEIDWVMPLLWLEKEELVSATGDGEAVPLFLNFNIPSLPYVNDVGLRFDLGHTSNEGARIWARDLAMNFMKSLES